MLGGLLGLGGGGGGDGGSGPILTTTGSVSIVADGRLNALIVQANAVDMRTIEMILEVVDREESPEDVRTTSKPQLIPVIYQSAADVATIVKSVYADRSGEQRGGGGGGQPQMSPQDLINAIRGGGGRGGRGGASEQATKPAPVTIAVDSRSNSLIVTAPPQDVEDIRELVEVIDAGGMESEETVEIVSLKGTVKAEVVQQALDSILGTKAKTTAANATTPASGGQQPAAPGQSPEDIQRRIEFFRQMRQGGGFGGGPPGGGFGGGGGRGGRGGGGGGGGNRGGGR
jgi:type II secretory pathway component GspD/PulD (secretin)